MLSLLASAAALLPLLTGAVPMMPRVGMSQYIQWGGANTNQCLGVSGTVGDGTSVIAVSCTQGFLWDINSGDGLIRLHGTNYCLDAGTNPHNNVLMKVWTCYPGLTQQQWYYTNDDRIAITGGNQCLDEGPIGPQTYPCTTGNTNQIWYTFSAPPTSTTSTSSSTTSTSTTSTSTSSTLVGGTTTTSTSASSSPSPPSNVGVYIHPNGDNTKCLTAAGSVVDNGTPVEIQPCVVPNNGTSTGLQYWNIASGSGPVQLYGTNFCLDAGVSPHNTVSAKIWTCYAGLTQQTWYYTDDNRIAITGGNQCLDQTLGSQTGVQTWQCTTGDNQQVWTL